MLASSWDVSSADGLLLVALRPFTYSSRLADWSRYLDILHLPILAAAPGHITTPHHHTIFACSHLWRNSSYSNRQGDW